MALPARSPLVPPLWPDAVAVSKAGAVACPPTEYPPLLRFLHLPQQCGAQLACLGRVWWGRNRKGFSFRRMCHILKQGKEFTLSIHIFIILKTHRLCAMQKKHQKKTSVLDEVVKEHKVDDGTASPWWKVNNWREFSGRDGIPHVGLLWRIAFVDARESTNGLDAIL